METGADCLAVGTAGAPERMMEMNYVLYCFFQIIELVIHTGSFIWFLYSMPREVETMGKILCLGDFCCTDLFDSDIMVE